MASSPVTSVKVAEVAGVSQATVSLVLNGHGDRQRISQKTQKKILEAADSLNYLPNRLASGLKSNCSGLVAIVTWGLLHPLHAAITQRIINRLLEQGLGTMLFVDPDMLSPAELRTILGYRPEGILIGPLYSREPARELEKLLKSGFPIIGYCATGPQKFDNVSYDRSRIIYQAIQLMHRLGERRFEVVVGGLRQHLQAQVREILAQDDEFLRDSQPEDVTFHEITGSTKNGYYFAREILSRRNPSKAYFFQDNRFATGFHRGCLEAGLSIPEDVKFVVGNRVEDTEFSPLHLTTIYPSLDTMAERIVALLQARLQTPKSDLPCQEIFLPQEIELGESTHGGSNHAEG